MGDGGDFDAPSSADDFLNIVREGRSFSGRERHCAFLNLGDGTFCNVSVSSGFDLPDDGRALALVDWDRDGRLDVWISNRNGPQLRFLRNQTVTENHFLALRLQGTSSNRDAIGARVWVFLKSDSSRPLTRAVRAGSGFLSQSTKWLHFGLGTANQVDRVVVDWPSGISQTLEIPAINRSYHIVEGGVMVRPAPAHMARTAADLPQELANSGKTSATSATTTETSISALTFSMIHLPAQTYKDLNSRVQPILVTGGRSVLVHLWADWCQPCVKELAEFSREASRLRQQGIDVLALSVDAATPVPRSSPASESELLTRIAFPFRAGRADRSTVEKLQLLHDALFELHSPLPIPTSFLIDRQGRVTAVYKGVVTVDRLLVDKKRMAARTTQEWRMATMVFPGRWIMPPRRRHLFDFVSSLADRGYHEDCARYVGWNKQMLTSHPAWQQLSDKIQQD